MRRIFVRSFNKQEFAAANRPGIYDALVWQPLFDSPNYIFEEESDMSNSNSYPWWDDRVTCTASFARTEEDKILNTTTFESPKSLYSYFDSKLYGCHEYKKAMATAIWSSIHLKTKTNFLVIGPSGCGKTELARIFAKAYKNTAIFDASSVSAVSYKGHSTIAQCLMEVDTGKDALPPWIFIDEIDKAILKNDECGPMIMNELLKMIEGGQVFTGKDERSREAIDTTKVNFVLLGTFSDLKNGQKNPFGFAPSRDNTPAGGRITRNTLHDSEQLSNEFLGRINGGIIEVDPIERSDAVNMLCDPRYSPVTRLEKMYQLKIDLSEEKYEELVSMTAKYGIRGIYSELQSRINDALFEDCTIKNISL